MGMMTLTLILSHMGFVLSPSQWPLKLMAASIIGVKWLHMFSAEYVRLVIAATPASAGANPTYFGDLIYSDVVQAEIAKLTSTELGKVVNSVFFLPFLEQSYHREQLF